MSTSPQKVALYSVNDLKNATDDAIAPYLTTLPKPYAFRQEHTTTNVKLALGYTAVLIAGVLFYADWKLGWDATKAYTAPACVAYFVLNSALTYWIWAVEAGTVFVGVRDGGQKVCHSWSRCVSSPTIERARRLTQALPDHDPFIWEETLPCLQTQSHLRCTLDWQEMGRQGVHRNLHAVV
ncbi:hypothetical protein CLAIMM_13099 isoform 2 [Cladophialophora immunda]|nr:hypothetical protein CLAIMM_13099 isoform 2 [Cladophialophora immunda]